VPVLVGEARATLAVGEALRARGFAVGIIRPPTVPAGASRLRVSVSAAHTAAQLDAFLAALADALAARDAVGA
jgi:8-amino-7-oxononanoate synthase